MKSFNLILSVILLPTIAMANGRDEASQLCTKLTFSSDRDSCLKVVRDGEFFTVSAAKVCAGVTFSSDAVACMKAIKDRTYLSAEIDTCAKETFGSSTTDCFKKSGKPYKKTDTRHESDSRLTDSELLRDLRQIERDVRDDRRSRALDDLSHLIRKLERRMN